MSQEDIRQSLRRRGDFPTLLLSQDYELFFQQGGTYEKCLIEPSEALHKFAAPKGIRVTFYVDVGMLCCMQKYAAGSSSMSKMLTIVKKHIESLHARGHEIALHIHPHWEDTQWINGEWDFSASRYQLRDFESDAASDIVSRYTNTLKELCNGEVKSYRAGGFCVEPFELLKGPLKDNGILIDSSIVPGARIVDDEKGFDFSKASKNPHWFFDDSPLQPTDKGIFVEVPVTPLVLPIFHYWGRAVDKLLKRRPADVFGDGLSKALGRDEIIRRLMGFGRTSELSLDAPKAHQLISRRVLGQARDFWHIMGHPKLLGQTSLDALDRFIDRKQIKRFDTVSSCAADFRSRLPP